MKVIAVIQARMGSTRFPGKVMQSVVGVPLIELLLYRLSLSTSVDQIVLATTDQPIDHSLAESVSRLGYAVYRGSEEDVLDRYYQVANLYQADVIVRITGDCPLVDAGLVDTVVARLCDTGVEYVTNRTPPTYPDGLDVEAFTLSALKSAWKYAQSPYEREHVTAYFYESDRYTWVNVPHHTDLSSERWTVDEVEDLALMRTVFEGFSPRKDFSWQEVLDLKKMCPQDFSINTHLVRNEGSVLGTGQKLWKRAKGVIPGGNMLLSKRSEMFLPEQWPAYFSRAKGCEVWDMDGKKYLDMSIMGIGTNILGYGHSEVDAAVQEVIKQGNMSTLNCPEEVYLAEKLVAMHPWADMARFARSGGEANAIAIRIARAFSGKDQVAICGYHGWHDWYLSANLTHEDSLDGHLLPGLDPLGVPKNLAGSVFPFQYNCFDQLEEIVLQQNIGVIKMEVSRNSLPQNDFLHKVRRLASEQGIVLIFDESTSGFRQSFGGLHKYYQVEPDMAVFGKALGNGYAITATIGRREIMDCAQNTFISSTFWTERIGPVAALKTLEVMEKTRAWEVISQIGEKIAKVWQQLAEQYQLPIVVSGLPAMISFVLKLPDWLKYKTLLTQEMLKEQILASNAVYVCVDHTETHLVRYFSVLERIFQQIRRCELGELCVDSLLKGPVCHTGFQRLT